jgi:hypothetical protein
LEFWVAKEKTLKTRSSIAFDILSVPATTAPIERSFSMARAVFGDRRNRLSNEHLNQELMFRMNGFLLD